MVVLRVKPSEETAKRYTLGDLMMKVCDHLVGEPAYINNDILVSDVNEQGVFMICLGGAHNEEELILDVTM